MPSSMKEVLDIVGQYLTLPRYKITSDPDVEWDFFPAVVKIATMEHKTELGGVVLNIKNRAELKSAIEELLTIYPEVIVQEQISGVELFLGGREDPSFGPVVTFGLGGVFVEIYRDITTRLAPLTGSDVDDMVRELRGGKALKHFRGRPMNYDALLQSVVSFSLLIHRYRPRVAEVNPLILNEEGAYAVDVRLALD